MGCGAGPSTATSAATFAWSRVAMLRTRFKERECGLALRRFRAPRREVRERRPLRFAPLGERERGERRVVLGEQAREQRMLGVVRLDHDFAGPLGAARAARNLEDRLREPLVAARIRAEQALVRVQHADERDARKVVALSSASACRSGSRCCRSRRRRARQRARPCGSCTSRSSRAMRAFGNSAAELLVHALRARTDAIRSPPQVGHAHSSRRCAPQ